MSLRNVRVESDGIIARITLSRPDTGNALTRTTLSDLLQALTSCAQHIDTHYIALAGDGPDFCVGYRHDDSDGDLTSFEALHHDAELFGRILAAIPALPKPVIAITTGRVMAEGIALAAACDTVIAPDDGVFGYAVATEGAAASTGRLRSDPMRTVIERALGQEKAGTLFAIGAELSAREAQQRGLVQRVVEAEGYYPRANKIVLEIADSHTFSYTRPPSLVEAYHAL